MTEALARSDDANARALEKGLRDARETTRRHAKSFAFASHLLPGDRRAAAYAVYAFCRSADDAVDEAPDRDAALLALEAVRARLDVIFSERVPAIHADLALAHVARRWGLARAPFDALLDGMAIDLSPVAFETWAQLEDYCFKVAGVVGHMLLPVLGASSEEARDRAADLGIAMQLTNILRDVGEDLGRGRIYLPAEELAAFGLTHEDVRGRTLDARWRTFLAAQIARARAYYARAAIGFPLIETRGGRVCARAMGAIYGDILRELERGGHDPFAARARTSTPRKAWLATLAVLGHVPAAHAGRDLPRPDAGPIALEAVTRAGALAAAARPLHALPGAP